MLKRPPHHCLHQPLALCCSVLRRYAGQPADEPSSSAAAANGTGSGAASSKAAAASTRSSKGGKRTRGNTKLVADEEDDDLDPVTGGSVSEQGYWKCKICTVNNVDLRATACEVCGLPRPE